MNTCRVCGTETGVGQSLCRDCFEYAVRKLAADGHRLGQPLPDDFNP